MDEQKPRFTMTTSRLTALQVDARKVVLLGTAVWFVLAVVSLCFFSWLDRHGHRIWFWTSLDGFVLGLIGLLLMVKHRREGRVR